MPERAFSGLERSLKELDLSGNRLTRVPHQAIRNLVSLRRLDLSREPSVTGSVWLLSVTS